jgi:hypothetical protein
MNRTTSFQPLYDLSEQLKAATARFQASWVNTYMLWLKTH